MSAGWVGFIIGLLVGINLAVVVIGLTTSCKCGECGQWLERKLNG